MTWSILARDPVTGAFGVAVTTKAFAVGAYCPRAVAGRGCLSTQATTNPLFGLDGSMGLLQGRSAPEIMAELIASDPGQARRQFHIIDAEGHVVQHTGTETVPWAGAVTREGVSVAGNMLVGPDVVTATLETFLKRSDLSFPNRLLTALDAGQAAGGDKRGRQSAAMKIADDQPYLQLDIRVDDHTDPLVEMRRLLAIAETTMLPLYPHRPRTDNPAGTLDRTVLDQVVADALARRG